MLICVKKSRILIYGSYNHHVEYLKYENECSLCSRFVILWLQFQFIKTKKVRHKKNKLLYFLFKITIQLNEFIKNNIEYLKKIIKKK
jgi:hypothetical protein